MRPASAFVRTRRPSRHARTNAHVSASPRYFSSSCRLGSRRFERRDDVAACFACCVSRRDSRYGVLPLELVRLRQDHFSERGHHCRSFRFRAARAHRALARRRRGGGDCLCVMRTRHLRRFLTLLVLGGMLRVRWAHLPLLAACHLLARRCAPCRQHGNHQDTDLERGQGPTHRREMLPHCLCSRDSHPAVIAARSSCFLGVNFVTGGSELSPFPLDIVHA